MKKLNLFTCAILLTTVFVSCVKEASDKNTSAQNISNASSATDEVCRSRWEGEFDQNKPPRTEFTNDRKLILDGYAHIPVPYAYTHQPFVTKMTLNSPGCSNVDADSVRMAISLKNPTDSTTSIYAYNVYLYMYGSTDSAYVNFAGNTAKFTSIGVGNIIERDLVGLLHVFSDYTLVTLEAKDHVLSAYIKGKLVGQVDYTGTSIGALQKILIGFKGSGYVDYIKLYNSSTGALIMKENFDVAGKSTDTWYY